KYLLVPRPWDDKSKFLAQAGFTQDNPDELMAALRRLAAETEAVEDGTNEYGTFYRVEGELVGPVGRPLAVVAVWLRGASAGPFRSGPLKPWRVPRPCPPTATSASPCAATSTSTASKRVTWPSWSTASPTPRAARAGSCWKCSTPWVSPSPWSPSRN